MDTGKITRKPLGLSAEKKGAEKKSKAWDFASPSSSSQGEASTSASCPAPGQRDQHLVSHHQPQEPAFQPPADRMPRAYPRLKNRPTGIHYTTCGVYFGPHVDMDKPGVKCCSLEEPHPCCHAEINASKNKTRLLNVMAYLMPSEKAQRDLARTQCYTKQFPQSLFLGKGKEEEENGHDDVQSACLNAPPATIDAPAKSPEKVRHRSIWRKRTATPRAALLATIDDNGGECSSTGQTAASRGLVTIPLNEPVTDAAARDYDTLEDFFRHGDNSSDNFDVPTHASNSPTPTKTEPTRSLRETLWYHITKRMPSNNR